MEYKVAINDTGSCEPIDPTKVEIIGNVIKVTFANGSIRQDDLPTTSLTGYVTTQQFNDKTYTVADISGWNPLDYATAAQGAKADTAVQPGANLSVFTNDAGYLTSADLSGTSDGLGAHIANVSNPHGVTKGQVGLGNVDNTTDATKPVSNAQQIEINNKYNAAVSYTNSKLSQKVDKVTGSRLITTAEGNKLAEFDEQHYRRPVVDINTLANLSPTNLFNNERRYVVSEGKDYFYDAGAIAGDVTPVLQANGTGFWKTSTTEAVGSSYTQWRLSTGGTFRTNMIDGSILDLKAVGLLSVAYAAGGVVTYSTTATQNSTDAQLRDRTTHTGAQAISTVTGLQETLDSLILPITQVDYDALEAAGTLNPKTLYVIPC